MADAPLQDAAAQEPGNIDIGNIQIPPVGAGMAGISNGIAQAKNALSAGVAASPAGRIIRALRKDADDAAPSNGMESVGGLGGPTFMDGVKRTIGGVIDASGVDVDNAALSGKMGIAGALGGQSFMDGLKGNVGGGIDGPQVAVGASAVDGTEAAQAAQTPPQAIGQEPTGDVPEGAAAETEAAQRMPPDAVGAPNAVPETQPAVTGIAAIVSKIQEMIRPPAPMAGIPTLDSPDKGSVIGQALDKLSEKRAEQGASASGGSPTFTVNLTINVEGGGNIKEDVTEAAGLGAREFDKMMRQWMKQNARKTFA